MKVFLFLLCLGAIVSSQKAPYKAICRMTQWTEWSACSGECGSQIRRRAILEKYDGYIYGDCEEHVSEVRLCNMKPTCQDQCIVSPWSLYDFWDASTYRCAYRPRYRIILQNGTLPCPPLYEFDDSPNADANSLASQEIAYTDSISNARDMLRRVRTIEKQAVTALQQAQTAQDQSATTDAQNLLDLTRQHITTLLTTIETEELAMLARYQARLESPASPLVSYNIDAPSLMKGIEMRYGMEEMEMSEPMPGEPIPTRPPRKSGQCGSKGHDHYGNVENFRKTPFQPVIVEQA